MRVVLAWLTIRRVNSRIRWIVLGLVAVLMLGVSSSAAGGADPVLIVTPPDCCGGGDFSVQALDGTLVSSVPVPAGTDPVAFAPSADGLIAYDDASQSTGDSGPVWLVSANQAPLELDSSPDDFDASISYDGSKVTFARYDPVTGASDVYVVNADGSGLTRVAAGQGDSRLSSPRFSPDGSSIAYVCNPATSGLGTSLGCGPTVEGTYSNSGVMLMNADGSDKRLIVMGSAGLGEGLYSWSPDGRSLTGTSCVMAVVGGVWSCGPNQVFVYATDGSDIFKSEDPSLQVTHETANTGIFEPQFSSGGAQLLFMKVVGNAWGLYDIGRDGTNERPTSLAPQASFAVLPPATGGGPLSTVKVTQPGGLGVGPIVVRSEIAQCRGLIELAADGAFTRCMPFPVGGDGAVYAPSADGSVVLSDDKAGSGGDGGPVWLVKADGHAVELDPSPYDFDPSASYDGSKVTFARFDPATKSSDIYTINNDGSGRTLVASGGGTNELSTPTFSPDGGSIAYSCHAVPPGAGSASCGPLLDGSSRASGVMLMKTDGSDKRMILVGVRGPMSWSPDGQWLAMTHCVTRVIDKVSSCDANQIFVYRTDGSDVFNADDLSRQITHGASFADGAFGPQFSPDGTQIVFVRAGDGKGDQGDFSYVINRDGTGDHEVSLTPDPPRCTGDICDQGPTWGLLLPPAGGRGPSATVRPTRATVPNVRTLGFQRAKTRLAVVRLRAKVTRRNYSSRIGRGHVIAQYPHPRTRARLGKKGRALVRLVLSRGPRPHRARR